MEPSHQFHSYVGIPSYTIILYTLPANTTLLVWPRPYIGFIYTLQYTCIDYETSIAQHRADLHSPGLKPVTHWEVSMLAGR